jgi:predicted DNA-binding transcriptional regulator AlpA
MSRAIRSPLQDTTPTAYLPARMVQARYRVSEMTLWRWLANPDLRFPKPLRINRYRYWPVSELDAWDASRRAA